MLYTEVDLQKFYSLAKRGYTFVDSINSLKLDREKQVHDDRLEILKSTICEHYAVNDDEIMGRSRLGHIVEARRMFCYLSRMLTPKSLKVIGKKIDRDHATVLHQFNNVAGYVHISDSSIISDIDTITSQYLKRLNNHENELEQKISNDV
jgi:chromosomal replication initiation ATPase DnaA